MPQFDFGNVFVPQLFWLAVFFAILYFGIVRATLPKLGKVMDERVGKIDADLAAAQAAKQAADEMGEAYRRDLERDRASAHEAVAQAKKEAALAREKRLAEADARSHAQLEQAEAQIAGARQAAGASLRDAAIETTQSMVAKLTGATPAPGAVSDAVDSALPRG
jgi:F-type H+-transporting ATPase subunit b